jgi:hypothetical protein
VLESRAMQTDGFGRTGVCLAAVLCALALSGCGSDDGDEGGDGGSSGAGGSGGSGGTPVNEQLKVGVGVADLTPTAAEIATNQLFMGAYGIFASRGHATGVHDQVYARVMVIQAGAETVALASLDMPGISNRVQKAMREGVATRTGLPVEAVMIGATHSHSAPDLQGLWNGVPDDYKARLIDLTVDAISTAFESREAADLFVSLGEHSNSNRRDWPMTDKDLVVLDAKRISGERIGTLVQFAAHPVTLGSENLEISRDFPGYTVDRLEAELGGTAIYFNGIIGDCTPGAGGGFEGAEDYGGSIADAAIATMSKQTRINGEVELASSEWDQMVTNANFKLANSLGFLDYDTIGSENDLGVHTQVRYFRLGREIQGVAFPGESLTRNGLAIKEPMKAPFKLFLGLTTDSLGYFVPSDEWMTGRNDDYEEQVSMGRDAGDTARDTLLTLIEQGNQKF